MPKPNPELLDEILWKVGILAVLAVVLLIELTK